MAPNRLGRTEDPWARTTRARIGTNQPGLLCDSRWEFTEQAERFSVAGVLALFAVAALIASAVAGLSLVLPVWVSAVIVGAVLVALACMTALVSRTQIARIGAPKTMAAVTQDNRTYEIGPFPDDDT